MSDERRKKARVQRLKRRYGFTEAHVQHILDVQKGKCAICQHPILEPQDVFTGGIRGKMVKRVCYAVDHDHRTGKVRGLLCRKCNLMIAYADEDEKILQRAIAYLVIWSEFHKPDPEIEK